MSATKTTNPIHKAIGNQFRWTTPNTGGWQDRHHAAWFHPSRGAEVRIVRLIEALRAVDGMVVLSGYESSIYETRLHDWQRRETTARISGGRGTSLRTEVVWLNPACAAALDAQRDQGIFTIAAAA